MNLTLRILGAEILHISTDADPAPTPDVWSLDKVGTHVGFAPRPDLPIREPGRDLE